MRITDAFWAFTDARGNVAITVALALPLLLGFTGLGAESAYWLYEQRRLQAAADLSAYAGAVVARAGAEEGGVADAARTEVAQLGLAAADLAVNWPPLGGGNTSSPRAVEVLLRHAYPRFFSAIYIPDDVVIEARAVARYDEPGRACILSLHPTQPEAMLFSGSASAQFTGCDLMSNSLADDAISIKGAVEVTASCVNSAGGIDNAATLILDGCPAPRLHMPMAPDPYASLEKPDTSAPCSSGPYSPGQYHYCGLTLSGNVLLSPGEYIVSGGELRINGNANVTGEGVTFYLTDGARVHMNGTARVSLSAPTEGPYQGMLFFADPDSPGSDATFNGTADSALVGALYFPRQHVAIRGDFSASDGCTRIVGQTIEIRGNPSFSADCEGTGINEPGVPGAVRLVE